MFGIFSTYFETKNPLGGCETVLRQNTVLRSGGPPRGGKAMPMLGLKTGGVNDAGRRTTPPRCSVAH